MKYRLFLLQSSNIFSLCPLSSFHSTSTVLNICYKVPNSQVPKYTLVSYHICKMKPRRLKATPTYHPTAWEIRNSARVFRSTEQTPEHPSPTIWTCGALSSQRKDQLLLTLSCQFPTMFALLLMHSYLCSLVSSSLALELLPPIVKISVVI